MRECRLYTIQNLMIHLHPGTTAQYICNSDALARKAVDNLHLQPSRSMLFKFAEAMGATLELVPEVRESVSKYSGHKHYFLLSFNWF